MKAKGKNERVRVLSFASFARAILARVGVRFKTGAFKTLDSRGRSTLGGVQDARIPWFFSRTYFVDRCVSMMRSMPDLGGLSLSEFVI